MHECVLSDEICNYVSSEDYSKLVSEPSISEKEVKFFEDKSLEDTLKEFGYQELSMWEILFRNPFTCEWEHLIYTKLAATMQRFLNRGYKVINLTSAVSIG